MAYGHGADDQGRDGQKDAQVHQHERPQHGNGHSDKDERGAPERPEQDQGPQVTRSHQLPFLPTRMLCGRNSLPGNDSRRFHRTVHSLQPSIPHLSSLSCSGRVGGQSPHYLRYNNRDGQKVSPEARTASQSRKPRKNGTETTPNRAKTLRQPPTGSSPRVPEGRAAFVRQLPLRQR